MNELKTESSLFPPYNIVIDNKQYIYKGGYANGNFSYRCPHRSQISKRSKKAKYKNKL